MSDTWSLVTGGSSGLGVAFAQRLAADGSNVWLAARNTAQMEEVAADLEARFGVATRISTVDLTDREARASFISEVESAQVSHLVNNAGFAQLGAFAASDPEGTTAMLELNTVALTELIHAVLPAMTARGRGAIINVASTAAFQPTPNMAAYAATKAYVLRLSIALWEEFKPSGIRVIASCPGATETGFWAAGGNPDMMQRRRTPEQVVTTTFAALAEHRPFVVDGPANKLMAFTTRLAPHGLQARIARLVTSR